MTSPPIIYYSRLSKTFLCETLPHNSLSVKIAGGRDMFLNHPDLIFGQSNPYKERDLCIQNLIPGYRIRKKERKGGKKEI